MNPKRPFQRRRCLCPNGDGIAAADLAALLEDRESHAKIATMTIVRPTSLFGVIDLTDEGSAENLRENKRSDDWIAIRCPIFEPEFSEYLEDNSGREQGPLHSLSGGGQIAALKHNGLWPPMDPYREPHMSHEMWDAGTAP